MVVAAGAALPPEVWAASMVVFSQSSLSAPDVVLSCDVEWVEPVCSCWETNCCVLVSAPSYGATRYACWQYLPS